MPADTEPAERIRLFRVFMPGSVMEPLRRVLMSGYIGEGARVEEFERALRPWTGSPNVLALNSGTSALELALHLAGVGPGDEVISTPLTCVATNHAILHRGARVVWADTDPSTGNIDPGSIRLLVTARTKAVMVVHWGGDPCELDEIHAIAAARGLKVIEDAGHAFGADYGGAPIGSHSHFVCFSFQAVKILTTVDGGALTCQRPEDHERGRLLRWYGIDRRERRRRGIDDDTLDITELGYKIHMNDVCATVGLEQLRYVGQNLARTRANAARYDEAFAGLTGVKPLVRRPGHDNSHWLYTVKVRSPPEFRAFMNRAGIDASQVHVRNDRYRVFRSFAVPLPGLDTFCAHFVCIPVGWWLGDADVDRVVAAVEAFDREAATDRAQSSLLARA